MTWFIYYLLRFLNIGTQVLNFIISFIRIFLINNLGKDICFQTLVIWLISSTQYAFVNEMLFLFQENAWRIRMLPLHLSQKWFINHAQFSLPLCRTLFWALCLVFLHYRLCLWLCIISTGGTGDGGECSSTSGQYSIFSEVCVCTLQKKT